MKVSSPLRLRALYIDSSVLLRCLIRELSTLFERISLWTSPDLLRMRTRPVGGGMMLPPLSPDFLGKCPANAGPLLSKEVMVRLDEDRDLRLLSRSAESRRLISELHVLMADAWDTSSRLLRSLSEAWSPIPSTRGDEWMAEDNITSCFILSRPIWVDDGKPLSVDIRDWDDWNPDSFSTPPCCPRTPPDRMSPSPPPWGLDMCMRSDPMPPSKSLMFSISCDTAGSWMSTDSPKAIVCTVGIPSWCCTTDSVTERGADTTNCCWERPRKCSEGLTVRGTDGTTVSTLEVCWLAASTGADVCWTMELTDAVVDIGRLTMVPDPICSCCPLDSTPPGKPGVMVLTCGTALEEVDDTVREFNMATLFWVFPPLDSCAGGWDCSNSWPCPSCRPSKDCCCWSSCCCCCCCCSWSCSNCWSCRGCRGGRPIWLCCCWICSICCADSWGRRASFCCCFCRCSSSTYTKTKLSCQPQQKHGYNLPCFLQLFLELVRKGWQ